MISQSWFSLLLLVPAIILPVILLVGFAGCDRVFGLTEVDPTAVPIIDKAAGKDGVTITVIWHSNGSPHNYEFERTDPEGSITNFDVPSPAAPFDDSGLNPATSYAYRVRAIDASGEATDWSASVSGTTLPFVPTYAKTLTVPAPGWEGNTVVQRIEATSLMATGPHVRITLQASSESEASIDRVYISQAASAGKPYDSSADLTAVYDSATNQQQPFVIPAGTTKSLPIVAYTINKFQPLLIAIDFSATPASGVEYEPSVPNSEAMAYFFLGSEAAVRTRSVNYAQNSTVLFITNVEVG